MNTSLYNLKALVCGASQGIGKACAFELAREGAEVMVLARNEDALKEVVAQLHEIMPGKNHVYMVLDFDDLSAVASFLEHSKTSFDIVINNSGGPPAGELMKASADDLIKAFNRHVVASQLLIRQIVPHMKQTGHGRIVNIISTSVKQPIPGLGVSNTIRGAMANWAKTLAEELGPFGITVNNVLPGRTETQRLNSIMSHWAETRGISLKQFRKEDVSKIPLRRFGKAEEIGSVVAFLSSPAASYISGTNIVVDGGRTRSL
jgi:3-oxoacyl-[acyl-carrier protein] reductase